MKGFIFFRCWDRFTEREREKERLLSLPPRRPPDSITWPPFRPPRHHRLHRRCTQASPKPTLRVSPTHFAPCERTFVGLCCALLRLRRLRRSVHHDRGTNSQIELDAPFSATRSPWARALRGMAAVLLVTAVGQARYLTHMGPPCLGNPRRRHRGHARGAHRRHRLLHLLRHSLRSPVHLHAGCARHAPHLPWLPSAPISITIFPLGSNDGPSFQSIWTVMLILYCYFFGLHAA